MRQIGRIRITLFRPQHTLHHLTHFLTFDMDGWHHDMARMKVHPLKDTFAEITLDDIIPLPEQILIHTALFRQHGFTLDQCMGIMLLKNPFDDLIMLHRIFRPMDNCPIGYGILLKLFQQCIQMAVGVEFYIAGQFA